MSISFSTRLSLGIAEPFIAYCNDAGLTKSEVMARALSEFLATHKPRPTAYELAMQVLAETGTKASRVDSADIDKLKPKYFRDKRSA